MTRYLVLLRGINVGGKSLIKMADLKASLTEVGFGHVSTYIQSGNVFVTSESRSKTRVAEQVSATITERFGLDVRAVAFSEQDWQKVVHGAPGSWGTGDGWKHDLLVLLPPLSAKDVLDEIREPTAEIEMLRGGKGVDVVYASAVVAEFGRTRYSKVLSSPLSKQITVRNYNTSIKLLTLFG